jgi:hypothetical protein
MPMSDGCSDSARMAGGRTRVDHPSASPPRTRVVTSPRRSPSPPGGTPNWLNFPSHGPPHLGLANPPSAGEDSPSAGRSARKALDDHLVAEVVMATEATLAVVAALELGATPDSVSLQPVPRLHNASQYDPRLVKFFTEPRFVCGD